MFFYLLFIFVFLLPGLCPGKAMGCVQAEKNKTLNLLPKKLCLKSDRNKKADANIESRLK
jgi:hypothetical protein